MLKVGYKASNSRQILESYEKKNTIDRNGTIIIETFPSYSWKVGQGIASQEVID